MKRCFSRLPDSPCSLSLVSVVVALLMWFSTVLSLRRFLYINMAASFSFLSIVMFSLSFRASPIQRHLVFLLTFGLSSSSVPTAELLGDGDVFLDNGSTLNLTCVVHFSPTPPEFILWYHRDKVSSAVSLPVSFWLPCLFPFLPCALICLQLVFFPVLMFFVCILTCNYVIFEMFYVFLNGWLFL